MTTTPSDDTRGPVAHARATLEAGVTTLRDLGTEGAFEGDVDLKKAIDAGVVPGPRVIPTTRAIVAVGAYGPSRSAWANDPPQGAQEASGVEGVTRAVRDQVGRGAEWIKVYADFGWGPGGTVSPTFTQDELDQLVRAATDAGASCCQRTDRGTRTCLRTASEVLRCLQSCRRPMP